MPVSVTGDGGGVGVSTVVPPNMPQRARQDVDRSLLSPFGGDEHEIIYSLVYCSKYGLSRSLTAIETVAVFLKHGLEPLVDDLLNKVSEHVAIVGALDERPKPALEVMSMRRSVRTRGLMSCFVQ